MDADEEAMINAPLSKVNAAGEAEAMADDVDLGKMTNLRSELEDEEERHGPREPLVCVLQSLNSVCIHWVPFRLDLTVCRPR